MRSPTYPIIVGSYVWIGECLVSPCQRNKTLMAASRPVGMASKATATVSSLDLLQRRRRANTEDRIVVNGRIGNFWYVRSLVAEVAPQFATSSNPLDMNPTAA